MIVLADGAGGTVNGAVAAQAVIDAVTRAGSAPGSWSSLLQQVDRDRPRLAGGQTTAVVVSVTARGLTGASVGDSGAWVVRGADIVDLTDGQRRKPLLGDGASPFEITAAALGTGTLLVASDGLLRYARSEAIVQLVSAADLAAAARGLVDLVRLRSGALPDDVSVVLCRAQAR